MPRTKKIRPKPLVLVLLEGWGIAPAGEGNAITSATTPYLDKVISRYPVASLVSSGEAIGLAAGLGGSSRVGHVVIGTGHEWQHSLSLVNAALANESFGTQEVFKKISERLSQGSKLHLVGLLSAVDAEASFDHIKKLLDYCVTQSYKDVVLHCILDGRDSSLTSGQHLVHELEEYMQKIALGRVGSLMGRFYAMDEKYNVLRIEKACKALISTDVKEVDSAEIAINESYEKKIFDEELSPIAIAGVDQRITNNDVVIFWNHVGRSLESLVLKLEEALPNSLFVTLTPYTATRATPIIDISISSVGLGRIFAARGLHQLRMADSAGFSGVSSWFDGVSDVTEKVDRRLIPTKANLSVIEAAADTIKQIQRQCIEAVQQAHYDVIIITFSQPDTVAHSASFEDLVSIIEKLDDAMRLMMETVETAGGVALITGTHGLAEKLIDPATGARAKEHSINPVPLYLIGSQFEGFNLGWPEAVSGDLSLLNPIGSLIDIAPTALHLIGFKIPEDMPGKNLVV